MKLNITVVINKPHHNSYNAMQKVSIITAVYNGEQYLSQCLDSLVNQTYDNIEIICVDDASTDGSMEIFQDYARRDGRIKVVRQSVNGGAQLARQAGVDIATGDYIMCIDGDDWLDTDSIEICVRDFEENPDVDCLVFNDVRHRPDGSSFTPADRYVFHKITGEQSFYWSLPWHINGRKIVRAELQRRFPWDNSCRVYGDDNTSILIGLFSRCVMQTRATYNYRLLPASLSHGVSMGWFTCLRAHNSMSVQLRQLGVKRELRAYHETFRWEKFINSYRHYYMLRSRLTPSQRSEALAIMREQRHNVDFSLVSKGLKRKFGYMPLLFSWKLFRLQEEIYFTLRTLLGRKMKNLV